MTDKPLKYKFVLKCTYEMMLIAIIDNQCLFLAISISFHVELLMSKIRPHNLFLKAIVASENESLNCQIVRLSDCQIVRLSDCQIVRLSDCEVFMTCKIDNAR